MHCKNAKQLIPDWLKGDVDAQLSAAVKSHVDGCLTCRKEAEFWRLAGDTLREHTGNMKAPAGFTAGVMARLPAQQAAYKEGIFSRWKRNMAVAAAFLLVAAGSLGTYLHAGGNIVPQIATNTIPQNQGVPAPPADGKSPAAGGAGQSAAPGAGGQTNNPEAKNNGGGESKTPTGTGAVHVPGIPVEHEPQMATGAENQHSENYAWLNAGIDRGLERTIMLKVRVDDMDQAHQTALSVVDSKGAEYEILVSEDWSFDSEETMKITTHRDNSVDLLKNMESLGQVIETKNTVKEDITDRYNENLEQYHSLAAQVDASMSEEEIEQLQVKMESIKAQLKEWDMETNTDTIILWMVHE